jgi:acylphosphatase
MSTTTTTTTTAVRLRIEGQVQGVMFRAWTVEEARRRGLRGWVRNRHDGSVEALLIGDAGAVEDMVAACRRGPRLAAVDRVDREEAADDGSAEFHQLPTV